MRGRTTTVIAHRYTILLIFFALSLLLFFSSFLLLSSFLPLVGAIDGTAGITIVIAYRYSLSSPSLSLFFSPLLISFLYLSSYLPSSTLLAYKKNISMRQKFALSFPFSSPCLPSLRGQRSDAHDGPNVLPHLPFLFLT